MLRGELTQKELAEKANINHSTYAKLEQGERRITFETAAKLGIFHGIHPYTFLMYDKEWAALLKQIENIDS